VSCFDAQSSRATSSRIDTALTLEALQMALSRRDVKPGLIQHTDRGSQYASTDYQKALREAGLVCSMSRKGDCYDNAVAESFFATLEWELLSQRVFPTRERARSALFDYIEVFYNAERRHSYLDYASPIDFERTLEVLPLAAQTTCLRDRGKSNGIRHSVGGALSLRSVP
jgi:transposase InsO family protein